MTSTHLPSMIVEDVELRTRASLVLSLKDPLGCEHVWEPHVWDMGRAYCMQCGSRARWVNGPRMEGMS